MRVNSGYDGRSVQAARGGVMAEYQFILGPSGTARMVKGDCFALPGLGLWEVPEDGTYSWSTGAMPSKTEVVDMTSARQQAR